jgi:hypothetical protein
VLKEEEEEEEEEEEGEGWREEATRSTCHPNS